MAQARHLAGLSLTEILSPLGLSKATYYRWRSRAKADRLKDQAGGSTRRSFPPTPQETQAVCAYALTYTATGYKRLTWQMVDQDVACLRPYQVYNILTENNLLARQRRVSEALRRPAEPDHPDQVWHIDLMYVYIGSRWYYLVDILDAYSRYLVHWSLNLTMEADTVTLTVQEALEGLPARKDGEPKLVHDHGSQFISREWHTFIQAVGLIDIPTRIAHPQSNGRLERLHRTHREEGLIQETLTDYYQTLDAMGKWQQYYNHQRPHWAIQYLCPIDYYRGDPATRLAQREQKLVQAAEHRRRYWQNQMEITNPQISHFQNSTDCLTLK